jgi:hypothetical protein
MPIFGNSLKLVYLLVPVSTVGTLSQSSTMFTKSVTPRNMNKHQSDNSSGHSTYFATLEQVLEELIPVTGSNTR